MDRTSGIVMEFKVSFECEKRSSEQNVTYCNSGPHQNHRRSRRSRHTPSGWKCSDGSRIQTGWMYKTCLQERVGSILQSLLHLSCVFPSAVGSTKKNSLAFFSFSFCYDLCVFMIKMGITGQLRRRLTTVCLISPVLTVILFIAGPTHRNAPTAGASKEVDWTFKLPLICNTTEKKRKQNIIKNLW